MARTRQTRADKGTGAGKGQTPFAAKPTPAPDLVGRTDIALARVIGLAVKAYMPDPALRTVAEQAMPLVQLGLTAFMGPKTQIGATSMLAVAAIREVKARLDEAEAHANAGGRAA